MANEDYLAEIVAQLDRVPVVAAAILSTEIFKGVVLQTHIDSGQAALNWKIAPYVGEPTLEGQQMLWGYGSVAPTAPAGYKWAKGANTNAVQAYLFEQGLELQLAFEGESFDGIIVYNPITPGFAGFSPGIDTNYEQYSLGDVKNDLDAIIHDAQAEMERRMMGEFSFITTGV